MEKYVRVQVRGWHPGGGDEGDILSGVDIDTS